MNWKNMPLLHKISTIISLIAVVFWLVSKAKPDFFPFDPTYLAIAVVTLCEAVIYWNQKRIFSYLLIAADIISLTCFFLEIC